MRYQKIERVSTEIVAGKDYTNAELLAMADQILRDDTKSELCRQCEDEMNLSVRGIPTGSVLPTAQTAADVEGHQLVLDFPEYECENGHRWCQGEGAVRGIGGDSPILFEEHFQQRRRREIYTSIGTPDPSIVAGIYNRVHPQGRKVNSAEQRKKNGAAFYR